MQVNFPRQIGVRLSDADYEKVMKLCASRGIEVADYMRKLVTAVLGGNCILIDGKKLGLERREALRASIPPEALIDGASLP